MGSSIASKKSDTKQEDDSNSIKNYKSNSASTGTSKKKSIPN